MLWRKDVVKDVVLGGKALVSKISLKNSPLISKIARSSASGGMNTSVISG